MEEVLWEEEVWGELEDDAAEGIGMLNMGSKTQHRLLSPASCKMRNVHSRHHILKLI